MSDAGIERLAKNMHTGKTGRYGEAFIPVEETLTWGSGLTLEELAQQEADQKEAEGKAPEVAEPSEKSAVSAASESAPATPPAPPTPPQPKHRVAHAAPPTPPQPPKTNPTPDPQETQQ